MHTHTILLLGVENLDALTAAASHELAAVAYLATHLCIERCLGEQYLVILFVFLFHLAIANHFGGALCKVVAHKLLFAFVHLHPVGSLGGGSVASTLFLLGHLLIKLFEVHLHIVFSENQLSEVEREAEGVVEGKCVLAADALLAGLLGCGYDIVEQADALVKSSQECFFLLLNHLLNESL